MRCKHRKGENQNYRLKKPWWLQGSGRGGNWSNSYKVSVTQDE